MDDVWMLCSCAGVIVRLQYEINELSVNIYLLIVKILN